MAKGRYVTHSVRCPKCKQRWIGTWPVGTAERVCVYCGVEFTSGKAAVVDVEEVEEEEVE